MGALRRDIPGREEWVAVLRHRFLRTRHEQHVSTHRAQLRSRWVALPVELLQERARAAGVEPPAFKVEEPGHHMFLPKVAADARDLLRSQGWEDVTERWVAVYDALGALDAAGSGDVPTQAAEVLSRAIGAGDWAARDQLAGDLNERAWRAARDWLLDAGLLEGRGEGNQRRYRPTAAGKRANDAAHAA